MRVFDVNVLVNALRTESKHHEAAYACVDAARTGREPVVILPEVAVGFLRIVKRSDLFLDPETSDDAMTALAAWSASPQVSIREAGPGRWAAFQDLMAAHALTGGDIHDGLLAAACLDMNATLVTSDRGFGRFEGLRVELLS